MTAWPEIPSNVVEGVRERWPERAEQWLASAGPTLLDLCAGYNGRPRDAFQARYGYVVAVDTPEGGLVIRSSPDPAGERQAKVSHALAALGVAPAIHQTLVTDVATWTVMDEIKPGIPFAATDRMTADLDALAAPFARIGDQPAPAPGMPELTTWLRDRPEDDHLADIPPWMEPATDAERRAALDLLADLESGSEPGLCHGDASSFNLVLSRNGNWLLIDPRGIAGEVAYDLAVLAMKVRGAHPVDEVIRNFARSATVDGGRIEAWVQVALAARV